jgi:multidrug efflux pump
MLSSQILRPLHGTGEGWASRSFDAFFDKLNAFYNRLLRWSLSHRLLIIGGGVVLLLAAFLIFRILPSELVPTEDRGVAFGIVIAPEGATLEYTDHYMRQIEKRLLALPELKGLFTATGLSGGGPGSVTNSFMFLNLKPRGERDKSQQQLVQELFPQLFAIPGVLAFVINPPSLGARFNSNPVEYVLQADSYEELNQAVMSMVGEASKLGYLISG